MKFVPLIILSLFFVGCATTYQPTSFTGGFSDKQLTFANFWIGFSGNGYTSASDVQDMCLLRAAEICYSRGFNYFVVHQENSQVERQDITTTNVINTSYGAFAVGSSIPLYKPSSGINIQAFKQKVVGMKSFSVSNVISRLKTKYAPDKNFIKGNFDIVGYEKQFLEYSNSMNVRSTKCSNGDDPTVVFYDQETSFVTQWIASVGCYDNPFTENQAKEIAQKVAQKINANTVSIRTKNLYDANAISEATQQNSILNNISFYFGIRTPMLGVTFEPALYKDKIYEIRNFTDGGLASISGLKLGDRVLSVEGISSLNEDCFDLTCYQVGDEVEVDVNRGGELVTISVTLTN